MRRMIMTPGPTAISEEVRVAMAKPITNPDLDLEFYEFYKEVCEDLKKILNTKNDTLVLSGEGILGLEAACASLIEEGDKVLCIENGIFGNGFGDFAKMYGAEVEYFHGDRRKGIDIDELKKYLEDNHNFKVATLVHCETPSGITNPIEDLCPLLKKYGIITVVDAVASIGGEEIKVDEWGVDIALGGSQKCLSAPPGLTFLSVSDDAWDKVNNRKSPIRGFYVNLSLWQTWYEDKWFPYTQPISDLYGFKKATERVIEDKQILERHKCVAEACRKALEECGLELFAENYHSNTVTTVMIPKGIEFKTIYEDMVNKHGIMIAGAFDFLKDKVFRIGHMGENCFEEKVYITLKALNDVFLENNIELKNNIHKVFIDNI